MYVEFQFQGNTFPREAFLKLEFHLRQRRVVGTQGTGILIEEGLDRKDQVGCLERKDQEGCMDREDKIGCLYRKDKEGRLDRKDQEGCMDRKD